MDALHGPAGKGRVGTQLADEDGFGALGLGPNKVIGPLHRSKQPLHVGFDDADPLANQVQRA